MALTFERGQRSGRGSRTECRGAARTVFRCRYLLPPKSATQMTPEKALGHSLLT